MKTQNPDERLREAILQLEIRQATERKMLKEQFHLAYESIKPVNLIKSTLEDISSSTTVKGQMVDAMIGLSIGFLSKLIFVGVSKNPLKKLAGNALMIAITNAVVKNPEAIKKISIGLYKLIKSKSRLREKNG